MRTSRRGFLGLCLGLFGLPAVAKPAPPEGDEYGGFLVPPEYAAAVERGGVLRGRRCVVCNKGPALADYRRIRHQIAQLKAPWRMSQSPKHTP